MKRKELKRKCYICGKVSYNGDTYGTRITAPGNKYFGKWVEYKCINKIFSTYPLPASVG